MFLAASHQVSPPPPQKNHHQLKIITTTEIASSWVAKKNIWSDGIRHLCQILVIAHAVQCSSFWWSGAFNINQFLVKPDSAGGKSALQLQEHLRPTLGGWLGHDGGHWTNAWTAQKKMRSRVDSSKCQSCVIFMARLYSIFILFKILPILILRIINCFICDYRHVL